MEEPFLSAGTDFGIGGHRYNDDLLLASEARERAQKEHEQVFHLLDHYELREVFRRENDAANRSKWCSHVAGFWAVTSAFLALAGAASEPLWGHLGPPWPSVIVIASAVLGLFSVLISALWLMYGKRKSAWLHSRLYTERLRQFHFQSFVWRLPEIVESLKAGGNFEREYRAKRDIWFNKVNFEMQGKGDAQMSALLHPTAVPPIWLHNNATGREEPIVPDAPGVNLQPVFRAYEVFRFDEQQGYAEYMLRLTNRPNSADLPNSRRRKVTWLWYPGINQPLRTRLTALTSLWIVSIAALVLMHLGVLGSYIVDRGFWSGAWPHVTIVWVALMAVAVKTLSEGFALKREVERYEEYRVVVSSLKQAFLAAETPRRKLQLMIEMEKASFEEMRVFLRSHSEATFIM